MKAWHLYVNDPTCGSLLVFAETKNKARMVGFRNSPWLWGSYVAIKAKRASKWDGMFLVETFIERNAELPDGAPPFYSEDDLV